MGALKRGNWNPLRNYGQRDGQLIHRTLLAMTEGAIIIIIIIIIISKEASLYLKPLKYNFKGI